ncbi:hypothetical protein LCI18_011077 [Fusarium solani-melongenae]|uniref:Uncharacterized protein n=1 Tax=Fusarium solani subsp. cucurbitae TaxID=2747967 RepID=A0ACD3ZFZ3_FUSSC|nr:hypothetical protein LCI18_011077 [Fusarium solani-melongenae]
MLSTLAMILEHADANPEFEITDVKAFLGHSIASHEDDSDLSLRMSDIKAAKDKFVDPQFKSIAASRRRSAIAPKVADPAPNGDAGEGERAEPSDKINDATQKEGKDKKPVEQVAGADDEDELAVDNDNQQREPEKSIPVKHQLPFMMPKPSQAASSAQFASNTASDALPLASSTTVPADSPNIKKRERSATPTGICPSKRARHDDGTASQDLFATRSSLMHATPAFLEALAKYIRAIERQHVEMGQEFAELSESLKLRTEPHRGALDRHKAAQANLAAMEEKISVLLAEEQKLKDCKKTLDDAKETWEQISEEKFQALQEAHWDKTTINATQLHQAESDRQAAAMELEQARQIALPALILIDETHPKLRELSMAGRSLNLQARHLGMLRSLVVLGAPAIDALDNELKVRGFSLKDIVQRIGQLAQPTNTGASSGQPSDEPTA